MNTPITELTLSERPQVLRVRWGSDRALIQRLIRVLRIARDRRDLVAIIVLQQRLRSALR